MQTDADVLIIGCGPGGSTAAIKLRQAGWKVIVVEKEVFPRFHIGESLLPYNMPIIEELGMMPAMEAAKFPKKFGAQFHLMDGSGCTRFVFKNGRFTRFTVALQVERATFDHLLMKRAREVGAEVREGWTFKKFSEDTDAVTIEGTDADGKPSTLRAKFLIDASGRNNVTAMQEKLREVHEDHRKFAVFGHFENVKLNEGEARGDTIIVRLENRWFWIIPVAPEKTSVGLVIDKDDLMREGGDAEKAFWRAVESSVVMKERLAAATLQGTALKTTADFSYHNRTLVTGRLLRVGDAAGFMDPIFSAGVYLAMWSANVASQEVDMALKAGGHAGKFQAYDRRVQKAMRVYWRLVEGFYTKPFIELFMQPKPPLDIPAAVVSVLGGELEAPFAVRWRLEVFYFLVWLQERRAIVPRITWPSEKMEHACAASERN